MLEIILSFLVTLTFPLSCDLNNISNSSLPPLPNTHWRWPYVRPLPAIFFAIATLTCFLSSNGFSVFKFFACCHCNVPRPLQTLLSTWMVTLVKFLLTAVFEVLIHPLWHCARRKLWGFTISLLSRKLCSAFHYTDHEILFSDELHSMLVVNNVYCSAVQINIFIRKYLNVSRFVYLSRQGATGVVPTIF